MDKYTVSKNIAVELKENGFPQNTHYFWTEYGVSFPSLVIRGWLPSDEMTNPVPRERDFAAPIAEEILERLPSEVNIPYKNGKKRDSNHFFSIRRYSVNKPWLIRYWSNEYVVDANIDIREESLANAAAQMYLYLKEKKLI